MIETSSSEDWETHNSSEDENEEEDENNKLILLPPQDHVLEKEYCRHNFSTQQQKYPYCLPSDVYPIMFYDPFILKIKNNKALQPVKDTETQTSLVDLPNEMLWMIFESLSPIKLGILKQTNSFFREICQDPELWRRCCLNYEHLFIWDNLIIGRFRNETVINGDLSNLNNSVKTDLINQTNADRPPLLTCSKTRREYIKTLKDPESEIIKKIKTLKRIYKEKKIANKKQETEYVKSIVSREYFSKVGSCLRIYLFPCVPIVFTIFTILLNLYMEKIWITKPIFVLIPVILLLIGGLLTILLPLIKAFNRYVFLPLGIGTLVFSVFNNAFVFHLLRYYEIIHLGPMLLVVPMAISLIIILSAYLYYSNPRRARLLRHWAAYISAGLFLCFAAFLLIWFLYRLGLKINDHDSMSLRETLFPLYIFDILPFFIPLIFICLGNSLREALILLMWIGVCYAALFIPFIVFEILIVLYLETSKISNFFMVMIPIYIWDIILFIIAKIYVTMLL